MKITQVRAIPLNIPIEFRAGDIRRETSLSACHIEIETDAGITGYGFTAITEEEVIGTIVNDIAAPAIVGMDALCTEAIWDKLYWLISPRGQTGYGMHAIAAIDIALWDIKGKALQQPIWKLLGGARPKVPLYATFGFGFLDEPALVDSARACLDMGFSHLKMVVGHHGMQRRDEPRLLGDVIKEDARRVKAVREAIGNEGSIYVDANCSLDAYHAEKLARNIVDYDIGFFEEPISQNNVLAMADLRRRTGIAVAAGQNEWLAFRFRDMLVAGAVDVVQPNVVITGGYTQAVRIAGMADAFGVGVANGGAWPLHNMHFNAGLANGGRVEWHLVAVEMMRQIYQGFPEPENGWLTLPTTPGLGFEPKADAIRELAKRPTSRGAGKA